MRKSADRENSKYKSMNWFEKKIHFHFSPTTGPILFAARNNDIAMMKFLAPLTNNPNMGNKVGTPIGIAAVNRHRDFERILRSYIRYLKSTPKSITNRDEYSRRRKKIEILV